MKAGDLFPGEEALDVLLVEDDDGDAELVAEMLVPDGAAATLRLTRVSRLDDAYRHLGGADVVLLDLMLPDCRGLETLKRVRERAPDVPVVVLSGLDDETVALDAVRNGAQDYIPKGQMGLRMLHRVILYAVERNQAERREAKLRTLESEVVERKEAERLLRESQARLAESQRIAHVGSWDWNIRENVITWSNETYRIFGRTARDYDGAYESFLKFLHPDDRGRFHDTIASTYETNHPFSVLLRIVRPDGSIRHVQARGETVTDDAGTVIRMVGTAQDVTEVTVALESTRQQNAFIALLQKVSSAANLAARTVDLLQATLPDIRRVAGGAAAAAHIMPGAGKDAVWASDQESEALTPFLEAARGRDLDGPLNTRVLATGKPQWTSDPADLSDPEAARRAGIQGAMGFPIHIGPTPVGVVQIFSFTPIDPNGTLIDVLAQIGLQLGRVVERRRAEFQLRQAHAQLGSHVEERTRELSRANEELKRSNAELEQFAFVASHDLREPLRRIHVYGDLLEAGSRDWIDNRARQYVLKMQASVRLISRLMTSLLEYSRVASPQRQWTPVSLGDAVADAARAVPVEGGEIVVGPMPDVPADPAQMRELFRHLLDNAAKFRSERPLKIEIGSQRDGDGWSVWVRDNGIGIEPAYHEKVFAIFQRLHTRAAYPGNGIGLAICRKIVEVHGGRIWVESSGQGGTGIWFRLPDGRANELSRETVSR